MAFVLAASAVACGQNVVEVPPLGETLIIVDTDMPAPAFVSRLRVDLHTEDGSWYATRDVLLSRPSDWPTSFGVYLPQGMSERAALVRLRAYPEGAVRDYRGERFEPRPIPATGLAALDEPAGAIPTDQPRILDEAGKDATPATEPQPLLTIDRLLRVRVRPHERGAVRLVLRGACVGTMADLRGARTCVDREGVLAPAEEPPIDPDMSRPSRSVSGSFDHARPCTVAPRPPTVVAGGAPLHDEEVCVPGAMFRLGSREGVFGNAEDLPERVAILAPFLIDKFEVSVARWRSALAAGFVSPDATPIVNDQPLPSFVADAENPLVCTWSTSPLGRESHALSCVSWAAARAFCRFSGGDLPSEAQWEHVAAVAGRPFRSRFAWGGADDERPTCDRAVWGRNPGSFEQLCRRDGFGPQPVDARAAAGGDVTPSLGVVGLGGGHAEWTRDAFTSMSATCWASSGLFEPGCEVSGAPRHAIRGASWRDNVAALIVGTRRYEDNANSAVGFRCVRRGTP